MSISFSNIPVGSQWSRPALATLWGYRAYQALARGVVTPAKDNKIILFVTEEKQASATNYKDILKEDLLQWEGPNDHFAEARMLAAKDSGDEIHLFHRPRHHMDFEYRGEIKAISCELKTTTPSRFVFEVLDPTRQDWTHDQLLTAFFLYMQLNPKEIQTASPAVTDLAKALKKPVHGVAAKLRTFTQLDPILSKQNLRASENVTKSDETVWSEFQSNWTKTTLVARDAYESIVGSYAVEVAGGQIAAADAHYLFKEGQTREAIVEVRRNQYVFRKAILSSYDSTCCVSGLKDERLLIASHIVPWAEDKKNRLNPENGLCLSALHDRAYDQGLLTVLPDLTIRIATELKTKRADSFLSEMLLRYGDQKITLPGRFRPDPAFLESHARRFGYI